MRLALLIVLAAPLFAQNLLPVWKAKDGSKWVWVKGEPHRISLPPPRVEWRDYVAYGAAVTADYATTRAGAGHRSDHHHHLVWRHRPDQDARRGQLDPE